MSVRFIQPHEERRCSGGKQIATLDLRKAPMKSKLSAVLIVVMLAVACRRGSMTRNQKNYQTVEEGSANGVTSTIQGPGETLPPITNTSVDTTGAFAIDPNAAAVTTSSAAPYPTMTTTTSAAAPPPTAAPPAPRRTTEIHASPATPKSPPPTTTAEPEPENTQTTDTTDTPDETQTDTAATSTEEPPPPPPPPPAAR
jgi:hypothetical protein